MPALLPINLSGIQSPSAGLGQLYAQAGAAQRQGNEVRRQQAQQDAFQGEGLKLFNQGYTYDLGQQAADASQTRKIGYAKALQDMHAEHQAQNAETFIKEAQITDPTELGFIRGGGDPRYLLEHREKMANAKTNEEKLALSEELGRMKNDIAQQRANTAQQNVESLQAYRNRPTGNRPIPFAQQPPEIQIATRNGMRRALNQPDLSDEEVDGIIASIEAKLVNRIPYNAGDQTALIQARIEKLSQPQREQYNKDPEVQAAKAEYQAYKDQIPMEQRFGGARGPETIAAEAAFKRYIAVSQRVLDRILSGQTQNGIAPQMWTPQGPIAAPAQNADTDAIIDDLVRQGMSNEQIKAELAKRGIR